LKSWRENRKAVGMMEQIKKQTDLINLSFGLESNASLWSIVFKGFDEEVIFISRFEGKDVEAIKILHKFGVILKGNYKDCQMELTHSGLVVKKTLPTNDLSIIREWAELMYNVREEMANLVITD
jgi:hypothetical protein